MFLMEHGDADDDRHADDRDNRQNPRPVFLFHRIHSSAPLPPTAAPTRLGISRLRAINPGGVGANFHDAKSLSYSCFHPARISSAMPVCSGLNALLKCATMSFANSNWRGGKCGCRVTN